MIVIFLSLCFCWREMKNYIKEEIRLYPYPTGTYQGHQRHLLQKSCIDFKKFWVHFSPMIGELISVRNFYDSLLQNCVKRLLWTGILVSLGIWRSVCLSAVTLLVLSGIFPARPFSFERKKSPMTNSFMYPWTWVCCSLTTYMRVVLMQAEVWDRGLWLCNIFLVQLFQGRPRKE